MPDERGQDCFVELAQEDWKVAADLDALLISPPCGMAYAAG